MAVKKAKQMVMDFNSDTGGDSTYLPMGWTLKTVGDLYNVIGGGTPSTAVPEHWEGEIPWITSADIAGLKEIKPRKRITKSALLNSATNLVPAKSLIVVTRVSLGKVALTSFPLCFSQDSQALIAKDDRVLPEYALYYLSKAVQAFKYQGRGTTISGVTKKQLKELSFPLPPLLEQERIVAKIEELFTQLEVGTAALKRVQAGLKRYKASVLKAAVEGRLLDGGARVKEGELPEGWRWVTVGEISDHRLGKMLDKQKNKGELKPYLRNINVRWFEFDLSDIQYMRVLDDELENISVRQGDLVVCEGGEPGRAAVWKKEESFIIQKALHRVRLNADVLPGYMAYCLASDANTGNLEKYFTGSTIKHFTGESLHSYVFPMPPLEEQHSIVEEIDRRLSVAQQVEAVVEASLKRAGRLRQAVLKAAFEGRLM
jgi:type I restriction enzyme, S subunit